MQDGPQMAEFARRSQGGDTGSNPVGAASPNRRPADSTAAIDSRAARGPSGGRFRYTYGLSFTAPGARPHRREIGARTAEVAGTHQVVVFTHDERLPEACRRLGVRARVLEVTRGDRSKLTVRLRSDPVDVYLDDARAVLATDAYPLQARRRVVPGLCRNAVEAACITVVRRRRIASGQPHAEVETLLDIHSRLIPRLALAFLDDGGRSGEVLTHVNTRLGMTAGDVVVALNRGAHQLIDTSPEVLVHEAERIARTVLALA